MSDLTKTGIDESHQVIENGDNITTDESQTRAELQEDEFQIRAELPEDESQTNVELPEDESQTHVELSVDEPLLVSIPPNKKKTQTKEKHFNRLNNEHDLNLYEVGSQTEDYELQPYNHLFTSYLSIFAPIYGMGQLCSGVNKLILILSLGALALPIYSIIKNAIICYRDHMHIMISLQCLFSSTSMFAMLAAVWFGRHLPESKTFCPHCYGSITKHIEHQENGEKPASFRLKVVNYSIESNLECSCQGICVYIKFILQYIANSIVNMFYTWCFLFFTSCCLTFIVPILNKNQNYLFENSWTIVCDFVLTIVRVYHYQFFCIICDRLCTKIECQLKPILNEMERNITPSNMEKEKACCAEWKCYLCCKRLCNNKRTGENSGCCASMNCCAKYCKDEIAINFKCLCVRVKDRPQIITNYFEMEDHSEPCSCNQQSYHKSFKKMNLKCIHISRIVSKIDRRIRWFLLFGAVECIIGAFAPVFQLMFTLKTENTIETLAKYGIWIFLRFFLVLYSFYKAYQIPSTYKSYITRYKEVMTLEIVKNKCATLKKEFEFANANWFTTIPCFTLAGIVDIQALVLVIVSAAKILFAVGIIPIIYEHLHFYEPPSSINNYYLAECIREINNSTI